MFNDDGGFDFNAWNAGSEPSATAQPTKLHGNKPGTNMARPPVIRDGDWTCACGNINFARRNVCNKCGKKAIKSSDASISSGKASARSHSFAAQRKTKHENSVDDWTCGSCMNHNWARRDTCNICNSPRPDQDTTPRLGRGGGHCDIQDPNDRLEHDSDDEAYDEFGRKKGSKTSRKIAPQQLKKLQKEEDQHSGHNMNAHGLESGLRFPLAPADACLSWDFKEQILEAEANRVRRAAEIQEKMKAEQVRRTEMEEGAVSDDHEPRQSSDRRSGSRDQLRNSRSRRRFSSPNERNISRDRYSSERSSRNRSDERSSLRRPDNQYGSRDNDGALNSKV